jgi:hypothetical protein
VVVAENNTTNYMRRVARDTNLTPGAAVFAKMTEAVEHIETLIATDP